MEKCFRFFHPLENRGGCNQVKLAGKGQCLGIPGYEAGRGTREELLYLSLAVLAKIIQYPFVNMALLFQHSGESARATAIFQHPSVTDIRLMREERSEFPTDTVLGIGMVVVAGQSTCKADMYLFSFYCFHISSHCFHK